METARLLRYARVLLALITRFKPASSRHVTESNVSSVFANS